MLVSSAMFSIGHGLNDSQKVMGIIAAAMIAAHSMGLGMGINSIADLPDWVAFVCFTAISLGPFSRMDSYDSCQCAFGSGYLYGRYFFLG